MTEPADRIGWIAQRALRTCRHPWFLALLVLLVALAVYQREKRSLPTGDAVPSRYLPLSILDEHDFDLDEFAFLYEEEVPYYISKSGGHYYSTYPIGSALAALPVYVAGRLAGRDFEGSGLLKMEKFAASLMVAISASLLFVALHEFLGLRASLVLAAAYAFGTSSWSVSSRALWQHPSSQMFSALSLMLLAVGKRRPDLIPWAGLACGLSVLCRPMNAIAAVILSAYVLHRHPRKLILFVLMGLPVAAGMAAYNIASFGSLVGGYAGCVNWYRDAMPGRIFFKNLLGLLVSPSRGLIIYSPFLLLSLCGIVVSWVRRRFGLLFYAGLVPVGYVLLMARWHMWYGGHTFGPRLLADALPYMVLLTVPVAEAVSRRRALAALAAGLILLSVTFHGLGAEVDDGKWNLEPENIDTSPGRLWDWRDPQLLRVSRIVLRHLKEWARGEA